MNYSYNYGTSSSAAAAGALGGALAAFMLVPTIIGVLTIIANWKIFTKAGREGWKAIIPIYNVYVLFEIIGYEGWKIILFLIPFYNIYLSIKMNIDLAKAFGKDTGFAIGLILLNTIFIFILGFGDSQYVLGNNATTTGAAPAPAPATPTTPDTTTPTTAAPATASTPEQTPENPQVFGQSQTPQAPQAWFSSTFRAFDKYAII